MKEIVSDYLDVKVFQQAKSGNKECGDTYFILLEENYFICAIADGLGNGPIARQSSQIIPTILKEYHYESIDELLSRCNEYMVGKRGAAVAIVKVDLNLKTIQYSCVGNVRFYMLHDQNKMIYPLPVMGYLSGRPQKLKTQEYPYKKGDTFILHSDGVEIRSPKATLTDSACLYGLYKTIEKSIASGDDATFIVGNLLS